MQISLDDVERQVLKASDFFAILKEPYEHKQHQNEQNGLDLYIEVLNFDTGEKCFKKMYKNSKGLHFKHTGYPTQYLSDFIQTITYIPYQIITE